MKNLNKIEQVGGGFTEENKNAFQLVAYRPL